MSFTPAQEALLKQRARALAAPVRASAAASSREELLVVVVGQARYALPLARLAGGVTLPRLTPLPGAPAFVAGLSHVQGRTLTVVSLGVLLGHPLQPSRLGALVEVGGEAFALGVPGVEGVQAMWAGGESEVPAGLTPEARRAISSVGPEGICRVDLDRLLDDVLTTDAPASRTQP